MDASDLEHEFFKDPSGEVWRMAGYFIVPSCILENVKTGSRETFGMRGLTAESFTPMKDRRVLKDRRTSVKRREYDKIEGCRAYGLPSTVFSRRVINRRSNQ